MMNPRQLIPILISVSAAAFAIAGCTDDPVRDGPVDTEPNPDDKPTFQQRTVTSGLSQPFEMVFSPTKNLWVTERTGKRVTEVSLSSGEKRTLLTIEEVLVTEGTQDGLLGIALHPELLKDTGNDFVYVAYTYDEDPSDAIDRRTKLRRYTYDRSTATLTDPLDLITGLPGSNDHNSGRLLYGPDGKLYYSIGDQGNNQLDNRCKPILAQRLPSLGEINNRDFSSYQGKILRLNTDGSVPDDNPEIHGVRSHIYTYGHRNPQGLAFAPDGTLYSTEHGPKSDDELNVIVAGKNYGWPNVSGYQDDQAYVYARWADSTIPCESLEFSNFEIPRSVPFAEESEWDEEFVSPIRTFYTVPNGHNFQEELCAENMLYFICWPTIAPSSVAVYSGDGIPGWKNSLLITTLKHGTLYRVPLSDDGQTVAGQEEALFTTTNRYRKVLISPDHKAIYLSTDSAGLGRDALTKKPTMVFDDPGVIFELKHVTSGGVPL